MAPPFFQLVESSVRFPVSMFEFGAKLCARTVRAKTPNESNPEAAFYAASQAMQREMTPLWLGVFQIGDAVQRRLIDVALARGADCHRDLLGGLPSFSGLSEVLALFSTQGLKREWVELRSKLEVFALVRNSAAQIGADAAPPELAPLVERAYAGPVFERIWLVEGLGHSFVASILRTVESPAGILSGPESASIPSRALTMLHAGMGLAFAERIWDGVSPVDDEGRFASRLERFATLCRANSREEYLGAALESLGLVTRTLDPLLVLSVDRAIRHSHPELCGYFWHGVGRALYFAPTHFVPGLNSPWSGILTAAPHVPGVLNLIAGLAWAGALVNLRHPEIIAELLPRVDIRVLETGAFGYGIASGLLMARDLDSNNPWIEFFAGYEPTEALRRELWERFVRTPVRYALDEVHSASESGRRFEILPFAPGSCS